MSGILNEPFFLFLSPENEENGGKTLTVLLSPSFLHHCALQDLRRLEDAAAAADDKASAAARELGKRTDALNAMQVEKFDVI